MASIAEPLNVAIAVQHLRPFDPRRDMQAVADLIELGFSDTLDEDGQRYLSQMRAAANSYNSLHWLGIAGYFSSYSMSGFVWEEDGRVVGNLSMIPYLINARRCYLIANVVVSPAYRRRGIGYALTARAIEQARSMGSPTTWLHVREENSGAINLYQSLGFIERARRTTWQAQGEAPRPRYPDHITITTRRNKDWAQQRNWLRENYPAELLWNLPLNLHALQPGILGSFSRFFNDASIDQWSIFNYDQLAGVTAWQSVLGNTNAIWLAAPKNVDDAVLQALLLHTRRNISTRRPLMLDYPAGQSAAAIEAAGFRAHQTLIWMEKKL